MYGLRGEQTFDSQKSYLKKTTVNYCFFLQRKSSVACVSESVTFFMKITFPKECQNVGIKKLLIDSCVSSWSPFWTEWVSHGRRQTFLAAAYKMTKMMNWQLIQRSQWIQNLVSRAMGQNSLKSPVSLIKLFELLLVQLERAACLSIQAVSPGG